MLSALPSYQLVTDKADADRAFVNTINRLPISYEAGVEQEKELYEALRGLAREEGWMFVDTLPALRAYKGDERLYNDFDYHFTIPASAIIGLAQGRVLLHHHRAAKQ